MTPSQLKYEVEVAGHERHFFDRKTMKFFGDTMSNYGVRSTVITSITTSMASTSRRACRSRSGNCTGSAP